MSTTTTLAILAAAELGEVVPNGDPASLLAASATLTLLVGAMLVLASILRLGFVANFISEPVLIGFKAGIGVVIVVGPGPEDPRGSFCQGHVRPELAWQQSTAFLRHRWQHLPSESP